MWRNISQYEAYAKQMLQQQQTRMTHCTGDLCCEKHIKEKCISRSRANLRNLIINSSKINSNMYQQVRTKAKLLYLKLCACTNLKLVEEISNYIEAISKYELWIEKLEFSKLYPDRTSDLQCQEIFIGDLPINVVRLIASFINKDKNLEYWNICGLLDNILGKLQYVEVPELPTLNSHISGVSANSIIRNGSDVCCLM